MPLLTFFGPQSRLGSSSDPERELQLRVRGALLAAAGDARGRRRTVSYARTVTGLIRTSITDSEGHPDLVSVARAIRRVLVDHLRDRNPARGRGSMEPVVRQFAERARDLVALDIALDRLEAFDREMSRAVELSFFAGCRLSEVASLLRVSPRTLERRWKPTRAWIWNQVR